MLLALALTACASKPAAPTAADFEVQPGEYRYQDSDGFFVETEKGNYRLEPLLDFLVRFAEPGSHDFMSCAISRTADMAMPIAMHTRDLPWAISISICMGCRTTVLTLSWYV